MLTGLKYTNFGVQRSVALLSTNFQREKMSVCRSQALMKNFVLAVIQFKARLKRQQVNKPTVHITRHVPNTQLNKHILAH